MFQVSRFRILKHETWNLNRTGRGGLAPYEITSFTTWP